MIRFPFAVILLGLALPAGAQDAPRIEDAGAYLAARAALNDNHFAEALPLFERAVAADPSEIGLNEPVAVLAAIEGDLARAAEAAGILDQADASSPGSNLALMIHQVQSGDWQAVLDGLEAGRQTNPIMDDLTRAWAHVGLGHMGAAVDAFDTAAQSQSRASFAHQHKALALAMAGDLEGAADLLSDPETTASGGRRLLLAHAEILSQLGRNSDAAALLAPFTNVDTEFAPLIARLNAGEPLPFTQVQTPATGVALALMLTATGHQMQGNHIEALLHARLAEQLAPDMSEASLLSAEALLDLDRPGLAADAFARIPQDAVTRPSADLGRARALDADGRTQEATKVLQTLIDRFPEDIEPLTLMGDMQRRLGNMEAARDSYTRALSFAPEDTPALWLIHYARGIAQYDLGDWPAARSDFRAALALNPDQPSVLNYLGYSMVERSEDLDEALALIEKAAALDPDNGAIVDSLGWALFRLGRVHEAVAPMERAATLESTDPIVIDHLGDVYWAVGRRDEARFQWQRALSFGPEPDQADHIMRKLDSGLDLPPATD